LNKLRLFNSVCKVIKNWDIVLIFGIVFIINALQDLYFRVKLTIWRFINEELSGINNNLGCLQKKYIKVVTGHFLKKELLNKD
jgi:hypothetical protein